MAYEVIARKWRPQTFDEVVGQEAITQTLRNAIGQERIHHAYLFTGARGVGKTTTAAKLAARALMANKTVALVSCDSFRVGAIDQLSHDGSPKPAASASIPALTAATSRGSCATKIPGSAKFQPP